MSTGCKTLYAFADTSNFVVEGESSGQVANPNNLLNNSFTVRCTSGNTLETFNSLPANWQEQWYGDADRGSGATVNNGQLVLQSDGSSTWVNNDSSGGELYFYKTSPVTTTLGFDVVVQVLDVQRVGSWSKAGIEIRNSVSSNTSPRVVLGVARENGASNYIVQPGFRDGGAMNWASPGSTVIQNNTKFSFNNGPMWLRIERVPGTNDFNFYYRQDSGTPPTEPAASASWWGARLLMRLLVTSATSCMSACSILPTEMVSPIGVLPGLIILAYSIPPIVNQPKDRRWIIACRQA